MGVRIVEPDANPTFSVDNGDYLLKFQSKRNGAALALEVGKDDGKSQKLELVNEKEVKAAKLPADAESILEIIVCPAGQRDIAAQKYYRILRTTADRELEKKKKEVDGLLAQKEKDYQKISDLFAELDRMQAALDSAKIREQALNIASINLDRASQLVKDAIRKIEEENDVEGALRILSVEALGTAYAQASMLKKKAETAIRQVIEGYEFKISLLELKYQYDSVALSYEKIIFIYETENYGKEKLAKYISLAANNWKFHGNYKRSLDLNEKSLNIYKEVLSGGHIYTVKSYINLAVDYDDLCNYSEAIAVNLKALSLLKMITNSNQSDFAIIYNNLACVYGKIGDYKNQFEFQQKAMLTWEQVSPNGGFVA